MTWVGMKEACLHLGVGRRWITSAIRDGMPAKQHGKGGQWRFSLDAVDEWMLLPSRPSRRLSQPAPMVRLRRERRSKPASRGEVDLSICGRVERQS